MGTWYKYILSFINPSFSVHLPLQYPSEFENDISTLSGLEWLTMEPFCSHIISDQNDDFDFPIHFLNDITALHGQLF